MKMYLNINMSRYDSAFAHALDKFLRDWGFNYSGTSHSVHVVSADYYGNPLPPTQSCAAEPCKHEWTKYYGYLHTSIPDDGAKTVQACRDCGVLLAVNRD